MACGSVRQCPPRTLAVIPSCSYDLPVDAIPESGLRYFADLRPNHVYNASDSREAGVRFEVVALEVHEYRTQWKGVEDPGFVYAVLELETQGRVVDDWLYPDGLQEALAHLDGFAGAAWDELPAAHDEAVSLIQERLAQPPGR